MEQSSSWKANRFSDNEENHHILWNPKVHYCIYTYKCPPPVPSLGQINPFHVYHPTSWRYILILSSQYVEIIPFKIISAGRTSFALIFHCSKHPRNNFVFVSRNNAVFSEHLTLQIEGFCGHIPSVSVGSFLRFPWAVSFSFCGQFPSVSVGSFLQFPWAVSFSFCGQFPSVSVGSFLQFLWAVSFSFHGQFPSVSVGSFFQFLWAVSFSFCGQFPSVSAGSFLQFLWAVSFIFTRNLIFCCCTLCIICQDGCQLERFIKHYITWQC